MMAQKKYSSVSGSGSKFLTLLYDINKKDAFLLHFHIYNLKYLHPGEKKGSK